MCGIAGFIDLKQTIKDPKGTLTRMTNSIAHRGPDDHGHWSDPSAGIWLGHRRLSILDLSPAGHQPMLSASGRYVIAFNGEIYNFNNIRKELENEKEVSANDGVRTERQWRGHSDTEVMLAAFEMWGIEPAVKRFVGMFAIALWDREERALHLVRDRIGEKPLYYGWVGETFMFASELKALRTHPTWPVDIDRDAVALLLRNNYIPAPYSIYNGIYKLLPGTILHIPFGNREPATRGRQLIPRPYWQAREVVRQGSAHLFGGSENEAIEHLDTLLRDSIKHQMVSDVPLGAFLSGGVDSSTIVALMQTQSTRPVKTFTIGFHEGEFNEAEYAKKVAQHLGTEHTELYVTSNDALAVIPKLPSLYDEPFSDSSQIPTFMVSQLTRQHVTVSLSGDAGDELFGGYNRYFLAQEIWKSSAWLPTTLRHAIVSLLRIPSPQLWMRIYQLLSPVLPNRLKHKNPADKIQKLIEIVNVDGPLAIYNRLISHWTDPTSVVINSAEPLTVITDKDKWAGLTDFTQTMMYVDMISYLPDDILVKVDRAAMGVSLETRVPFLDHRVIEFAWQLPLSMKIKNGQGKWILKQVLDKYVPRELIERPKTGFGVPIDSWLRGPLRDWAESLLNEERLRREGFFHPEPIRQKWLEHLSGTRNWHYYLWDVLMFQAWLEVWGKSSE